MSEVLQHSETDIIKMVHEHAQASQHPAVPTPWSVIHMLSLPHFRSQWSSTCMRSRSWRRMTSCQASFLTPSSSSTSWPCDRR